MVACHGIRVVLVETSHAGNIGATARAMKNMGLSDLYLVSATPHMVSDAIARAAGADDVLSAAICCEQLSEAIAGCCWVLGSSARQRNLDWPLLNPRQGATSMLQQAKVGPVAMVFGCERSGLSNEQLQQCHAHVSIPTNPGFSSLNLAAAVQILCYELKMAQLEVDPNMQEDASQLLEVSCEERERFFVHLEQVLRQLKFVRPSRPSQVLTRLRRLYTRARMEPIEVNILRGMLTAIQKHIAP